MVENVAFWPVVSATVKWGPLADFRIHPIGGDDELDGHGPIAADCSASSA